MVMLIAPDSHVCDRMVENLSGCTQNQECLQWRGVRCGIDMLALEGRISDRAGDIEGTDDQRLKCTAGT